MNLASMRQEYMTKGLRKKDLDPNPIKQFELWFNQAIQAGLLEPNAMNLATVGLDLMPSIRTVLLKMYDDNGFVFFSNYKSKGSQIGAYISHQSQIISSRSLLEAKFNEIKNKFLKGEVPFPSFWGGYVIKPLVVEFWQGGKDRLHDRFEYRLLENNQWEINRLEP